jgi:hypothetical protein
MIFLHENNWIFLASIPVTTFFGLVHPAKMRTGNLTAVKFVRVWAPGETVGKPTVSNTVGLTARVWGPLL